MTFEWRSRRQAKNSEYWLYKNSCNFLKTQDIYTISFESCFIGISLYNYETSQKYVSCQNSRFSWRLAYIYNIVNSRFCPFIKSGSGHSLNSFGARLMKLGMWIQINKQIIHVNLCFIQTTIVVAMVTKI